MTLSVSQLKGGVGKSTIAQNLGVLYAHASKSVCIVDADANQSSIKWSGLRSQALPPVPVFGLPDGDAFIPNVAALKAKFDVVIIDGTPSLSRLTSRIIMASDFVLIPMLPSAFDLWATTEKYLDHYFSACERRGMKIPAAFVLNQFKKTKLAGDVQQVLSQTGINVLENSLSDRVVYKNAACTGHGVYELHDKKTKQEAVRFFNELNTMI